jgi:hypothetical protein
MDILQEVIQELNYGISGPPQPGDTVVSTGPAAAAADPGPHAEIVAEAG